MFLKNKIIVITGGAGFLGQQFCTAIAQQGGIAIVADINAEAATSAAAKIEASYPGCAEPATLDISSKESISTLISVLSDKYGHIDAIVNNAYPRNKNYGRKVEDVSYEDFCENVNLHLGGYFLVTQQFCKFFQKQGHGNIINMSSIYGMMAPRFEVYAGTPMTMPVEYAAIKSAVNHLTRYFAQYYKKEGIRINCLSPGGILDRQPEVFLQKYGTYCGTQGMLDSSDINGSLLFLLSDASKHVTGQNLVVDDGFSL